MSETIGTTSANVTRRDFVKTGALTAGLGMLGGMLGGVLGMRLLGAKSTEEANEIVEEAAAADHYDEDLLPVAVRPVVVLAGTPREMGVQYGRQLAEFIQRCGTAVKASTLELWSSWDLIVSRMNEYEAIMVEKTPDAVEMWKGIAEGSGVDYDVVRLINLNLPMLIMPPENAGDASEDATQACSHFSVWGDATADGKMIAGLNVDQGWNVGAYTSVVIAHPAEGHAFIMCPPWAGVAGASFALNDAGLALTGSGGMGSREEDRSFDVDPFAVKLEVMLHCSSAEEAKDYYLDLHPCSAENAQFFDGADAFMIEYTPAIHAVRKAGDHGEQDYLIATNYFIDEEASAANYQDEYMGGLWDSIPRYNTYERLIKENYGEIDVEYVKSMLGCSKYWDGEKWVEDTLDQMPFEDPRDLWSPEARDFMYKTIMSNIAVPEDATVHFMSGQSDTLMSVIPYATGTYCALTLDSDVSMMATGAYIEAEDRIWWAAKTIEEAEGESKVSDVQLLEDARSALWRGFNCLNNARVAEGDDALGWFGKALTRFCEAQAFASIVTK